MGQIALFLHFVGLMLGATGGFGTALVMKRADGMAPDAARPLRQLGPMLAHVTEIGVALLWLTGLFMVWQVWGGFGNLPKLFWVKFIFVLTLTAADIAIYLTYREISRGNVAVAARLPKIGPVAGVSALLATFFAVFTFAG